MNGDNLVYGVNLSDECGALIMTELWPKWWWHFFFFWSEGSSGKKPVLWRVQQWEGFPSTVLCVSCAIKSVCKKWTSCHQVTVVRLIGSWFTMLGPEAFLGSKATLTSKYVINWQNLAVWWYFNTGQNIPIASESSNIKCNMYNKCNPLSACGSWWIILTPKQKEENQFKLHRLQVKPPQQAQKTTNLHLTFLIILNWYPPSAFRK